MRVLIFLLLCKTIVALQILAVWPSVTRSHYICGRQIIMELLKKGHQVVLISPFEETATNLTWVPVEVKSFLEAVPTIKEDFDAVNNFFRYQKFVWNTMNTYTEYIVRKPKLLEFIQNDRSHFDIIFAHEFFQPIFYTFAYKYKAPLVVYSTFGIANYINEYMGNPLEIINYSHEFANLKEPLGFLDKIKNFVYTIYDIYGRKYFVLDNQNGLVENVFKLSIVPNLRELEENISLVLINSHFSMSSGRSYIPNIIEIGGAHIAEIKSLDEDVKAFLDDATDGVILFSLGSFLELSSQTDVFISSVLHVLGNLKQRVVIKWSSHRNLSKYKNLYPSPWLSQNDILAHPNVVLFITHGGLLSNQEAVHHGIPIICIPFEATQPKVCRQSVERGYAIQIDRLELTSQVLNESIYRVLSDSSYKENAVIMSKRFKDRPMSPLDTAVYWLEYYAKHKGINRERFRNTWNCSFIDVIMGILIIYLLYKFYYAKS